MSATLSQTTGLANTLAPVQPIFAVQSTLQAMDLAMILGPILLVMITLFLYNNRQINNLRKEIKGDIDKFERRMEARFAKVDEKFEKVDARFDKADEKVDARFDKVDEKFEKAQEQRSRLQRGLTRVRVDVALIMGHLLGTEAIRQAAGLKAPDDAAALEEAEDVSVGAG